MSEQKDGNSIHKTLSEILNKILQNLFGILCVLIGIVILIPLIFDIPILPLNENISLEQVFLFMTLASVFPLTALAYKLFQSETQKRILENDLWLLGVSIPNDKNREDEYKDVPDNYESQKKGYQSYAAELHERNYGIWHFAAYSTLTVLLTFLGLSLFYSITPDENSIINNGDILQSMRFGFIGAYIYSMQLIYRRYTTLDLQPSVYLNCAVTLIAGVAFNFVAFKAVGDVMNNTSTTASTGLGSGVIAVVAFSLGYFPNLAIRWFNRITLSALRMQDRRANLLPLSFIDGISTLHETRLNDEGIDNIQNLASTGLVALLSNTRFSAQEIIDWVDQAILYTYLDQTDIDIFRRAGVRTFTDFKEQWKKYHDKLEWEKYVALKGITDEKPYKKDESAKLFMSTPERLDALYCAMSTGPNIPYVENYWRRSKIPQDQYERTLQYALEDTLEWVFQKLESHSPQLVTKSGDGNHTNVEKEETGNTPTEKSVAKDQPAQLEKQDATVSGDGVADDPSSKTGK